MGDVPVVLSAADTVVRACDAETSNVLLTVPMDGKPKSIAHAVTSQGTIVAAGCESGDIVVFALRGGAIVTRLAAAHSAPINHVAFSHNGLLLASTSKDRTVRLWDTSIWAPVAEFTAHTKWTFGATFSLDDQQLATSSADSLIIVWDVVKRTSARTLVGHEGTVLCLDFSPRRKNVLVSGDSNGSALVWDTAVGSPIGPLVGHKSDIKSVRFSPDDQYIVSGSDDGTGVWWISNGLPTCATSECTIESGPRLWDSRNFTLIRLIHFRGPVFCAAFAPNSKHVVVGNKAGEVTFWNSWTAELIATYAPHTSTVFSVVFAFM